MARLSPMMLLPVAVFAGFAGLAGWALMRDDPNSVPSALIAREAPAVGTTTLPGKTQLTDEMLRQPGVKLVNFWASWCPPCRAEHPTLMALAKSGVHVVGVDILDTPENALAFLAEGGNPFAALAFDPKGHMRIDWGVTGPPETFILRGDGTVAYKFIGPMIGSDYEQRLLPELEKAAAE